MNPDYAEMYAAIGRAVWSAQSLEAMIAISFEIVENAKAQDIQRRDQTSSKHLKTATKALLNRLAESGDIDPALYERIGNWIEKRHTLVHRWQLERGWPSLSRPDGMKATRDFSNALSSESTNLLLTLAEYLQRYASSPAGSPEQAKAIRQRVSRLFLDAGLQE